MKKILVVSDNPLLTIFFRDECERQGVKKFASISYMYSKVNKNPAAMINLGATPIDIKRPDSIIAIKQTYDLILSLHCKQIFPADLVSEVTCINVHPGLNPYNRGWYPQVFSIINGNPIGATMHLMDAEVDHGEIIDQIEVEIESSDTSLDVYNKVIQSETALIRKNLLQIIDGNFSSVPAPLEGNYNSVRDFEALCELDLEGVASFRKHIDLLRALSHGEFKNAYFRDDQGKKIFIRVTLEEET